VSYGAEHPASGDYLRPARKTAFVVRATIIAADLLFAWMAPREILEHLETQAQVSHSPDVSLADCLVATRDSLRMFRAHPWISTGLGSFETVFPQYQSLPTDLTWDHAHNGYAEALAETGLVGGVLILLAVVALFRSAFRNFLDWSIVSSTSTYTSRQRRVVCRLRRRRGSFDRAGGLLSEEDKSAIAASRRRS